MNSKITSKTIPTSGYLPNKYTKIINQPWVYYLVIITVTLLSYFNSINHEYNLDDDYIINALPKTEEGISGIFSVFNKPYNFTDYRPVVMFTYALEQLIFGLNPHISHIINILLFILLCVSIYRILSILPVKNIQRISFAATLIFCVHTSHTEVVCSIKNRDSILSMLFGIWSLYYFCKASADLKPSYYIIGFMLLLTGILSKLDAIVFLFLIPLTLIIFFDLKYKKLIGICLGLLLIVIFRGMLADKVAIQLPNEVGVSFTENPLSADPSITNKISQGIQSASYYLKFMLFPKGYYYYFGYDMIPLKSLFSVDILFLLFLHLSIFILGLYLFKRNKLLTYSILFFYFSLSYCLNLFV
ncbi:MAG TPA: glycosyltransferase family 39 protein, partial [Chitinophagales bacterium]|nr:glycosyltransferase family 39 protein [Chitinophagales bacterium]